MQNHSWKDKFEQDPHIFLQIETNPLNPLALKPIGPAMPNWWKQGKSMWK